MLLQNCADSTTIQEYVPAPGQWTRHKVMHLYKRLGFGATEAQIQAALAMNNPSQLVDQLLDTAVALPPPAPPSWANTSGDDPDDYRELGNRWMREMITESIRSKMALFWHGHFVTELEVYECSAYLWQYFNLLHIQAFGNFKTFVEEMGVSPAMLVYLNGNVNVAEEPNENYARELMELFTMGANNGYTSQDIIEVSRALTGWKAEDGDCDPVDFDPEDFDNGQKTIFGQTGNWNYDDVHNLIFTERQDEVALYIAEKIYKFFVYPEVKPNITNALADTFKNNNWELLPMLKQLFKSEHFFDETFIGGHIKSPTELFAGMAKTAELQYPDDYDENDLHDLVEYCGSLGQLLFEPTNVAGWEGYRTWVNENTMTNRWGRANQLLFSFSEEAKIRLRNTIRDAVIAIDPNDPTLITNPELISKFVVDLFINRALEPQHLAVAIQYLKAGYPDNYYEPGAVTQWNINWESAPDQIINLLTYLIRLPEFQMN